MTFETGEYKQKGYQSWCQRCPRCWANGITGFSQWTEISRFNFLNYQIHLNFSDKGIIEKCNECGVIILKDNIGKDFMKSKWKIIVDPPRIRVFGIIDNSENHPDVHMVEEIRHE